jgi:GNAT superfamily N-acetyltransferase
MSEAESVSLDFHLRPLTVEDRNWVAQFLDEHWGSTKIVTRGQVYYAHLLPGFAAIPGQAEEHDAEGDTEPAAEKAARKNNGKKEKPPKGPDPIGLITYRVDGDQCEIMTLDSLEKCKGVGTALIDAVKTAAAESGCKRMWLITTNDNLNALKFYQKRGFVLSALYPDALSESRKLKPQIPLVGLDSIPLRDEIELAMEL